MKKYVKNAVKSALSKPLRGRRYRRLLSIGVSALLAVSAFLTVIPQMSVPVYAAGTGLNLQLGTGPLENEATVYYGSMTDAIEWKIIGFNGTGVASGSGNATLISSGTLGTTQFSGSEGKYENSFLHTAINNILSNRFTDNEKADTVMPGRTLQGKTDRGEAYASDNSSYIWGSDLSGQKLWPLSTAEAKTLKTNLPDIARTRTGDFWWLRSPGFGSDDAAYVAIDGFVYFDGLDVSRYGGVRPALNINLSSIILTSAAEGGKISGATGAGALKPVGAASGNSWKLTIKDDSRNDFTAARTDTGDVNAGDNITISYNHAETGANEYVSVILVKADAPTVPLYYGRIANDSETSDSQQITIPSGLKSGNYILKVFSEQYNGDKKTDLASAFRDINITVKGSDPGPTPNPWPKPFKHKDDDDDHDDEPAPSNNNNTKVPDGCDELRQSLSSAIATAAVSGKPQTVYWNKGTSLPYDVMKMLHDNPNVTLVFSYTYLGQNYTVTIPGSAAIANPAVPWYGPVYLYALYGNTKIPALTTNTKATTGNYTVKSGDTLSAIAKRLKTTVKHLKDVNNIKNVDRIKPGMVLKY